jgi:hypothetical protein
MLNFFVNRIMHARWITNSSGEFGIRVFGINLWYYKYPDPLIGRSDDSDFWRVIHKREFGEVVFSGTQRS